jgi:hypothetical protein
MKVFQIFAMKTSLLFCLFCVSVTAFGQTSANRETFWKYLAKNMRFPAEARDNCVQQGTLVRFTVNAKGKIDTAYVSPNTHPALAAEINRVFKNTPPFLLTRSVATGSIVRGKRYAMPVRFRLEDYDCQPEPKENKLFDKTYLQGKKKLKGYVMLSAFVITAYRAPSCVLIRADYSPAIPLPRVEIKPVPLQSPK